MLDVLGETSQDEESDSPEEDADSEEVRNSRPHKGKRILTGGSKYYSRQQQLELVMAVREFLRYGEHDEGDVRSGEQQTCDVDT
jgi:hypothetical protein